MHQCNLEQWRHEHRFHLENEAGERGTWRVIGLTVFMMVAEIAAGMVYGSMALLADGWHMGTHALALGIAAFAYRYARHHADDPRFSFGTGKVGVLGGFASAVFLGGVALLMAVESLERLIHPHTIHFTEALVVAVIGLAVNLVSALLLKDHHVHSHGHDHHSHDHHDHEREAHEHHEDEHDDHDHDDHPLDEGGCDHNLKAAYAHVLADALTSVLAIAALLMGKYLGWLWTDPVMGVVGAVVIGKWAWNLIRETGAVLLDQSVNHEAVAAIRRRIEADADNRVTDIHVWRVGPDSLAAIVSVVTHHPTPPDHYKCLLSGFPGLSHVTVEVTLCDGHSRVP